jgi:hypothetical protein
MIQSRAEAPQRAPVSTEDHGAGAAQVDLGMSSQESHLMRQPVWVGDIVGIHSGQVLAACPIDTFVQTGREPPPLPVSPTDYARVIEAKRNCQALIV